MHQYKILNTCSIFIASYAIIRAKSSEVSIFNIYNGIIFPSLNPAKIFQFISRWTESTKSSAVGPNHMRSD